MPAFLITLLDYLGAIGVALGILGLIFSGKFRKNFANAVADLLGGIFDVALPILNGVEGALAPIVQGFVSAFQAHGSEIGAIVRPPIEGLARGTFQAASQSLEALGESTPDNAVARAAETLANTVGFGIASGVVTAAFEAAFPEKLNMLNSAGPILASMAGYEEVAKAIREPLYDAAFGKSAEYHYRSIFKPELPDEADAVTWHSRRLISDAQLRTLFGFSGLKAEYEQPFIESAYRAISPFMLAAGFTDQDFDPNLIRDAARFMGLRDQDVELIVQAVEVRSLQNVRNSYVQEAITAYGQGVTSDAELNTAFQDANWGQQARDLAFKRALLLRRINLARDAESFIVPEIASGLIADIDGINQLEAAGVQPWKAELQATKADARAAITARKKLLSEEQQAAARRRRNLTRAAVAEFQSGVINSAGLTAALLLIPLDPLEAASIVSVQEATRNGRMRLLYGKLLTPAQATTLHTQVEAVGDQYKKQLIGEPGAVGELQGLGVDAKDIQALLAKWGALRGKPTTTGVFNPV